MDNVRIHIFWICLHILDGPFKLYPSRNLTTPFLYQTGGVVTEIVPAMGRERFLVTGCHVMPLIKQTPWKEEILVKNQKRH